MSKRKLIDSICDAHPELQMTKKELGAVLETAFESITESVLLNGSFRFPGFGTFSLRGRPPRVGRNPRTGSTIIIPAKQGIGFKPAKELRSRIDISDVVSFTIGPVLVCQIDECAECLGELLKSFDAPFRYYELPSEREAPVNDDNVTLCSTTRSGSTRRQLLQDFEQSRQMILVGEDLKLEVAVYKGKTALTVPGEQRLRSDQNVEYLIALGFGRDEAEVMTHEKIIGRFLSNVPDIAASFNAEAPGAQSVLRSVEDALSRAIKMLS
jgi:integration host factor subunit beta